MDWKKIALFEGMSGTEHDAVLEAARRQRTPRGDFLVRQGEAAQEVFLLLAGRVKLVQVTPDGQEIIIRYIGPGEMFGVIAAVGGERVAYPVTAEAVETTEALVWPRNEMKSLMARYPRLALNAGQILTERVQEMQDRLRELATERVERRVARTLLRLARQAGERAESGVLINLSISRQDLAELSGTTLYTVSRILSQWEAREIIASGRERVIIRAPHQLVVIAEDLPAQSG